MSFQRFGSPAGTKDGSPGRQPGVLGRSANPEPRQGRKNAAHCRERIRHIVRHNSVAPAGALECEQVLIHGYGPPYTYAMSLILSQIARARGPQGDGQAGQSVNSKSLGGDQYHGGGHAEHGVRAGGWGRGAGDEDRGIAFRG